MGRPPLHDDAKLKQDMVDCLWQLGYDAPISAVVQSTGAKAASLYARFGSKKGMLLARAGCLCRGSSGGSAPSAEQHAPGSGADQGGAGKSH